MGRGAVVIGAGVLAANGAPLKIGQWRISGVVDLVWTCCILQLLFATCGPQQRELCASENTKIVTSEE